MKTNKQIQKEIEALANMPDSDIYYSDIPEMDSQIKFTRVSNKQFNEFVNSEVVLRGSAILSSHNMIGNLNGK